VSILHAGERIPQGVIERLPLYLNVLMHLREEGLQTASSARLSDITEVNAAQIRRDLAYFGQFGKRGVGYDIGLLVDRIQRILGSDHIQRLAIVGAGNLGGAIAQYDGLRTRGFIVAGLFDSDPRKVGSRVGDLIVRDASRQSGLASSRCRRNTPRMSPTGCARPVFKSS
jgi:redox-sensing transcriptional repressor